jgi:hypothetical protein
MNYNEMDKTIIDTLITKIIRKEKDFLHGRKKNESIQKSELKKIINDEVYKNDN